MGYGEWRPLSVLLSVLWSRNASSLPSGSNATQPLNHPLKKITYKKFERCSIETHMEAKVGIGILPHQKTGVSTFLKVLHKRKWKTTLDNQAFCYPIF